MKHVAVHEKRILIACIVIVLCFIVVGIIGMRISEEMPEETQNVTIITENEETQY